MSASASTASVTQGASQQVRTALTLGQACERSAAGFRARGETDLAVENLDRAIAHYSEAIRIDPTCAEAYVLRAQAWERKGEEDQAETDLAKARDLEAGIG